MTTAQENRILIKVIRRKVLQLLNSAFDQNAETWFEVLFIDFPGKKSENYQKEIFELVGKLQDSENVNDA